MMYMKSIVTSTCRIMIPLLLLVLTTGPVAFAAPVAKGQNTFASPDEAVKSLVEAVRKNDTRKLLSILGPEAKEIVSSGDPVEDKTAREKFLARYDEKSTIEGADTGKASLSLGNDDFPFAIPLLKSGKNWRFDTNAGKEEILNRRIGKNEMEAIEVLRAYADAQREYATTDWDGNGTPEFAQKVRSTPGKKDGLYWTAKEGEKESPLGPLAAKAAQEGYSKENTALYGYYFRILKAQGPDAEGGAFDYVANGKMILGFAMVAYPAQYGSSGIMTFIVNQNGIVYQKDLGKNTSKTATSMKTFNPDSSWKKVE